MSRHNSRVGFECSQELRLDNQLLELGKWEESEETRWFTRPTPSETPAQSVLAPAAGHVIQLLLLISTFPMCRH